MHLLLIATIVAVVVLFLVLRAQAQSPGATDAPVGGTGSWGERALESPTYGEGRHPLAFISRGKLFLHAPGEALREIHSAYVQSATDRLERSQRLHAWKEGTAFGIRAQRGRRFGGGDGDEPMPLQMSAVHFAPGGRMLYVLRDDKVGGLFEYELASGTEKRLLHRQRLLLDDLCLDAAGAKLLGAERSSNGSSNVVVLNADGSGYRELTGGDTVDSSPAWIPGREAIVFESAGLARSPQGFPLAHGPASIQMLELSNGALSTVLEHPRVDFMRPRVGADGHLYYMRRPYDPQTYGTGNAILDALAFPFRLVRALFHYLNFFSMMYSRKPLTSASGPQLEQDIKELLVRGKRIDAEAALRSGARIGGVPSLVPETWQLVRRSPQGAEQVLASHVASFDIAPDGAIVFSNGYGVFELDGSGAPKVLLRDRLIENVSVGAA